MKLMLISIIFSINACQLYDDNSFYSTDGATGSACKFVEMQELPSNSFLNVEYIQQKPNYCGPASLSMVLSYYGMNISQEMIAINVAVDNNGSSISDLRKEALNYGFQSSIVSCSLENLLEIVSKGYPTIVRISNSNYDGAHFVVVNGYNKTNNTIFIKDPANMYNDSIDFETFKTRWNINFLSNNNNSLNYMLIVKPSI